jgi:hypothetical protein
MTMITAADIAGMSPHRRYVATQLAVISKYGLSSGIVEKHRGPQAADWISELGH